VYRYAVNVGRPREHDEQTRRELLSAAEHLLAGTGPEGLSVRAIADAAGTTTRAVYSVFGSRAGLLDALAMQLFDQLVAAIDAVPRSDDPVADLVNASVQGFRAVMLAHEPVFRLVFRDVLPGLGAEVVAAGDVAFARMQQLVARVLPAGTPAGRVHEAALAVHSLTEGLAAVELRGGLGGPRVAKRVWGQSVAALAAGWTAPARPNL